MKLKLVAVLAICALSGCSSVTIRDKGTAFIAQDPTWTSSEPFFFWGLAGEAHVNVNDVCGGRNASQLQTQRTFVDGLLGLITIGIYSPRSARVWCQ